MKFSESSLKSANGSIFRLEIIKAIGLIEFQINKFEKSRDFSGLFFIGLYLSDVSNFFQLAELFYQKNDFAEFFILVTDLLQPSVLHG